MRTKIEDFLSGLDTEVDVLYYVDIDSIDLLNPFYSIYQMIENGNGFAVDAIYYSDAADFLAEHDPSKCRSLEIAAGYRYKEQDINDDLLSYLLVPELLRDGFHHLESDINSFFAGLRQK